MWNIVIFIIIGLISGWVASLLMRGRGLGIIGDIIVGIIGALIGGYVFSIFSISGGGLVYQFLVSLVGALVLLFIISLIRRETT